MGLERFPRIEIMRKNRSEVFSELLIINAITVTIALIIYGGLFVF